ncbi:hypothetical protein TbrSNM41_25240 (plasmid) [Thermus brockianus]|uniref:Uncharacterized protein n=1 Tax=Thermus brockianus TaxID=56956 RepID=A0ABN6NLC0_THEBO|nr:hypothetical protein TbrSNM41_25240 [Thermus brockianus]
MRNAKLNYMDWSLISSVLMVVLTGLLVYVGWRQQAISRELKDIASRQEDIARRQAHIQE